MLEVELLRDIVKRVDNGESVAVATITASAGSIPSQVGAMITVFQSGETKGSIGGGKVEYDVIHKCQDALASGQNVDFEYDLNENEGLACGGSLKGFIKLYKPMKKLVIFGAGHISQKLAKLAEDIEFEIYVIDNREEYKDINAFSHIKKYLPFEIKDGIKNIKFDKNTFVVVSTRSHELDAEAVSSILHFQVPYIGMVGSGRKVMMVEDKLREKGFTDKVIKSIYTPIGLNIDDGTPEEIALSILSEVVMVKNGKNLKGNTI